MSTSRSSKSSYHHGDLRSALVEAGLAILAETGDPGALSLRETARRAGVSAMAPYRHFADKDALLAAIATVGFERLAAAQREANRASDRAVALSAQGVAYVAFACDNTALFRLMFGSATPRKDGALAQAARDSFDLFAQCAAAPGSDAAAAADQVLARWCLVHGLAMLAVDGQLGPFVGSPVEMARRITRLAVEEQPD